MIIFKFFGIVIILVLVFLLVLVIGFVATVSGFLRTLFSGKQRQQTTNSSYRYKSYGDTKSNSSSTHTTSQPGEKKKIFSKDEGEYVDFEEIK